MALINIFHDKYYLNLAQWFIEVLFNGNCTLYYNAVGGPALRIKDKVGVFLRQPWMSLGQASV